MTALPITLQGRPEPLDPARRSRLGRRARLLAGASVAYNVVEAAVAITAGVVAGSVALVGFGLGLVVSSSTFEVAVIAFRCRTRSSLALSFVVARSFVRFRTRDGSLPSPPSFFALSPHRRCVVVVVSRCRGNEWIGEGVVEGEDRDRGVS